MYTTADFGRDLEAHLLARPDILHLSRWAYRVYLDNVHHLGPRVKEAIMTVVRMQEGPEFAMSKADLRELAERLQAEWEP